MDSGVVQTARGTGISSPSIKRGSREKELELCPEGRAESLYDLAVT